VSRRTQRRRGVALLALALASGGMAASEVRGRVLAIERQVGPLVPVVVARDELAAGTKLGERAVRRHLAVRQVPARFAPPDSFASPAEAIGLRLAAPLAGGTYLTAGHLGGGDRARAERGGLAVGERAIEVAVAGGPELPAAGAPAAMVDVLVTTDARSGSGRTFVALEAVELLALRGASPALDPQAADGGAARASRALATLRVSARQAVYLTAAQNFAQEVRLLARAPDDRARVGAATVEARGL
jgi:pilus assembly protein CpaB